MFSVGRRRWDLLSAAAAVTTVAVACLVVTPHDPGEVGSCGSLLGGGFTGLAYTCEQTRGVYRAVVVLGAIVGVTMIGAAFARTRWAVIVLGALAFLAAGLSLEVGLEAAFGDPLTYRWVALFPTVLAGVSLPGLWSCAQRMRSRQWSPRSA
jgi:hypothetical protein